MKSHLANCDLASVSESNNASEISNLIDANISMFENIDYESEY